MIDVIISIFSSLVGTIIGFLMTITGYLVPETWECHLSLAYLEYLLILSFLFHIAIISILFWKWMRE